MEREKRVFDFENIGELGEFKYLGGVKLGLKLSEGNKRPLKPITSLSSLVIGIINLLMNLSLIIHFSRPVSICLPVLF